MTDIIALICTSENKKHNFRPFLTEADSWNDDFRTFLPGCSKN